MRPLEARRPGEGRAGGSPWERPEIRATPGESCHDSSRPAWSRRRRYEPPQGLSCRLESPRGLNLQIGVQTRHVEPWRGSRGGPAGEPPHARPASLAVARYDQPVAGGAGVSHRRAHGAVSSHPVARTCRYGYRHVMLSHGAAHATATPIHLRGIAHLDVPGAGGTTNEGLISPRPHGPTAATHATAPRPHGQSRRGPTEATVHTFASVAIVLVERNQT